MKALEGFLRILTISIRPDYRRIVALSLNDSMPSRQTYSDWIRAKSGNPFSFLCVPSIDHCILVANENSISGVAMH